METRGGEVWVFGDYRDCRRNRVTLELIAKGRDLARDLGTRCSVVILGQDVGPHVQEYIACGAQAIYVMEAPHLAHFRAAACARALCAMVTRFNPDILLIGGTDFGRELAPRVARRLGTGLSADCVALDIDPRERILVQTTPAFGGTLLAEVVTPQRRPQMATVRPGTFRQRAYDPRASAPVIRVEPVDPDGDPAVDLLSVEPEQDQGADLETASVVVAGGQGMGSAHGFQDLYRLSALLGGQVGGTRPAVIRGWVPEERMIGQTGRRVRPRILITCGTSGALQYAVSLRDAQFVIAINKDPDAPIFRSADLGIVGDVHQILPRLIQALEAGA
jgi:electron transfer flavoprotein alpha subunit